MPSTITEYHTFTANTKARASQVNTNFSNYRGDLLPINEDTITASNLSHDLGSIDHRWDVAYLGTVNLLGATTTGLDLIIYGDTSATLGAIGFGIGGREIGRFTDVGLRLNSATTTVDVNFIPSTSVTTGSLDLRFGASTIASFKTGGLQRSSIDVGNYTSTGAIQGGYILTGVTALSVGYNSTTGKTITVQSIDVRGGGILEFEIVNSIMVKSDASIGNPVGCYIIDYYRGVTTTSLSLIKTLYLPIASPTYTAGSPLGGINCKIIDTGYSGPKAVCAAVVHGFATSGYNGPDASITGIQVLIKEI